MRKSFALGLVFLVGCGSIAGGGADGGEAGSDAPSSSTNDAQRSDSTVVVPGVDGSTGDAGGMPPPPDASAEDARRIDSGSNDGGSTIDTGSNDARTNDVSVGDAGRMDSSVGTDAQNGVDARADTGGSIPDVSGPVESGTVDAPAPGADARDVANDPGCIAETDQQLCTRLGKSCEIVSGIDNCGVSRTPNCGTCSQSMGCVDHVCKTPVCPSFNYASTVFAQFSIAGVQEYVVAASADGQSVLYVQSPGGGSCAATPIYLADETSPGSGSYTSRDITSWWTSNSLGWAALTADALTMIVSSSDSKTIGETSRSAIQLIDFGAVSNADYTAVNGFLAGTSGTFGGVAISTNGLELYYGITGISTTANGIYRSTRSTAGAAFSVGQRISSIDSTYDQVSAISSDRLTLFVTSAWAGQVFTRNSTSVEFSNPNGSNPPPQLQGWQHKPVRNCALFATYSPGGCLNQEVMYMTRQ